MTKEQRYEKLNDKLDHIFEKIDGKFDGIEKKIQNLNYENKLTDGTYGYVILVFD